MSIPQSVHRYWVIEICFDGSSKIVSEELRESEADKLAQGLASINDRSSLFVVASPERVYEAEPRKARRTFLDVAPPIEEPKAFAAPLDAEAQGHAPC